jgi:hypothetical protein
MPRFKLSATLIAAALLSVSQANATVITYTNEATWEAAVTSFVTEPFDSGGLQSFTGVVTTFGAIGPARGVLTGSVWADFVQDGASTTFSYKPGNLIGAGGTWDTSPEDEGAGLELTLNLVGGGTETVGAIGPIDGTFFGFVSSDPFTSFTISNAIAGEVETFDLDNLHFAPTTTVPEPISLSLFGAGLVGAAAIRRRKAKTA